MMGGAVLVGPGLAVGLVLGAGLGLGVTALATSARIKLTKSMVSNFIIFMEGPFFGWKKNRFLRFGLRLTGANKRFKTFFVVDNSKPEALIAFLPGRPSVIAPGVEQ